MSRLDDLKTMRDFIDREIAAEVLRNDFAPLRIVARAAHLYGIESHELLSPARDRQTVHARQAAAWLLRQSGMSLPQIGAVLGCHHTTIMHAIRRVDATPTVRALLLNQEGAA